MLGDNLHGKVVLLDVNVGAGTHSRHQSTLYLGTGVVGMVQDAELRVASLAVQVEVAVLLTVEVDAPLYEFLDLFRCIAHHLFHGGTVGDVVTGNYRVFYVLVKVVKLQVCHAGHATLCERCVSLVEACFTDEAYLAFLGTCHFQCIAHTGHSGTDNQEIVFIDHSC